MASVSALISPKLTWRVKTPHSVFLHQESPLPDHEDISFPHPDLNAEQVASICMEALHIRPAEQSLEVCFNYSSDRCRAAVGGSLEEFIQYASNPVFGTMVSCDGYEIISVGPIIPGSNHRGAMQTVLIDVHKQTLTVGDAVREAQQGQKYRKRPSALERRRQRRREESELSSAAKTEQRKPGDQIQEENKSNGKRQFLWTFQRERRPPRQNCWLVHEVLFVKNAFAMTE